jgi:uncharacterized protein (DUF58 family)
METTELIKKVRKIEIRTRGLSRNIFSGEYHSAFKGRGMAFSEVREYNFGDDVRTIDWNVSARFSHPYVKVFEEERELNVILLVDISASLSYGTSNQFKKDLMTEICAVLAFSAIQNNDKIGVIFFSDKIEKYIPPKKGKTHTLRIIRELLEFEPQNKKTDINVALQYMFNVVKKRSIAFIVSDFLTENFDKGLMIAGKKHDTIALQIYDKREEEIPNIGLVYTQDLESGLNKWIDTSSEELRRNYKIWWNSKQAMLKDLFNKSKVDVIQIKTDDSYIKPLMNFFKLRGNKGY